VDVRIGGRGRGSAKSGHLWTRGEGGVKKRQKCADVFYGWPLRRKYCNLFVTIFSSNWPRQFANAIGL
jgi:hypothetical protein